MGGWTHHPDFSIGGVVVAADPMGNRVQGWGVPVTAEYVRSYYKVPAKRGMNVTVNGNLGVITGYHNQYLTVRFVAVPDVLHYCHPTWRITYHTPHGPVSYE